MMRRNGSVLLPAIALNVTLCLATARPAMATDSTAPDARLPAVESSAWAAYKQAFVTPEGRVVDTANGNISHSEGQGYGMLLSAWADDAAAFERLWSFTRTELLIRDDGLSAWKWDPASTPHITDINNATDGDILIAYALLTASERWQRPDYRDTAAGIARTVAETMLVDVAGGVVILPGAVGFRDAETPGTLIVNPSYWVYPALAALQALVPGSGYSQAAQSGTSILKQARFGPLNLPTDWLAVTADSVAPAPDRPEVFGYEGIRIPLYLMMAGLDDPALLTPFRDAWAEAGGGDPAVIDVLDGKAAERLQDPGYRIVFALLDCALEGTRVPDPLRQFAPTLYYPSTLHLLALAALQDRYPQC